MKKKKGRWSSAREKCRRRQRRGLTIRKDIGNGGSSSHIWKDRRGYFECSLSQTRLTRFSGFCHLSSFRYLAVHFQCSCVCYKTFCFSPRVGRWQMSETVENGSRKRSVNELSVVVLSRGRKTWPGTRLPKRQSFTQTFGRSLNQPVKT